LTSVDLIIYLICILIILTDGLDHDKDFDTSFAFLWLFNSELCQFIFPLPLNQRPQKWKLQISYRGYSSPAPFSKLGATFMSGDKWIDNLEIISFNLIPIIVCPKRGSTNSKFRAYMRLGSWTIKVIELVNSPPFLCGLFRFTCLTSNLVIVSICFGIDPHLRSLLSLQYISVLWKFANVPYICHRSD
jgi:hypothetical protein